MDMFGMQPFAAAFKFREIKAEPVGYTRGVYELGHS